jgi:pyridoxine 4-dehydrogenase
LLIIGSHLPAWCSVQRAAVFNCMHTHTQVPIPGAKDLAQAKENLGALGWWLSAAEVDELDAVASGLKKGMIQNIFQTS